MVSEDFKSVSPFSARRVMGPRPAILVISISSDGKANGMTAAWTTPLSFDPPLVGVSIGVTRYTCQLIKESGEFTLNILDKRYLKQIHFLGTVSGREVDKLKECGLTIEKSKKVKAPHVAEAIGVLECRVEKEVETGDHVFFIGRVLEIYAKKGAYDHAEDMYVLKKAKIPLYIGGAYYVIPADELLSP